MYPVLFRLGSFEITSFGVMVGLAALVGVGLFRRELVARRLPEGAADGAVAGVVGGLAGAKFLWTLEHFGQAPVAELLLSRGGLSWFGGLAGGAATALVIFRIRGYSVLPIVAASTPALAVGHAIGRIGCFLVGDDYGRPTDLPWGVGFPQGLPPTTARVHPTRDQAKNEDHLPSKPSDSEGFVEQIVAEGPRISHDDHQNPPKKGVMMINLQ